MLSKLELALIVKITDIIQNNYVCMVSLDENNRPSLLNSFITEIDRLLTDFFVLKSDGSTLGKCT